MTVGLNLSWPSADYVMSGEQQPPEQQLQEQQQDGYASKGRPGNDGGRTVLYVAAMLWAQWAGSFVRAIGPYNLMACGVCMSVVAGIVLVVVDSCHAASVYGVPAFQGLGCASLAVAVPNYIVTKAQRSSWGVLLCLIEVFTLVGALIAHVLSILVTADQMNVWSTLVMFVNVLALLAMGVTTTTGCGEHSWMTESDLTCSSVECDPLVPEKKKNNWLSSIKMCLFTENTYMKNVLVAITLFAFRDFSGIYVFEKIILHVYNLFNAGPVSYRPCAFLITTLKLMFTIPSVVAIGFCGEKKLLLTSSFGMQLSMTILWMIIWHYSYAFVSVPEDNVYNLAGIAIVLLAYIVFFSLGLGSIPWAIQFQIINQKIRDIATGLIISAHFLFLMITEVLYVDDQYSVHSVAAYWFIFVCKVMENKVKPFISEFQKAPGLWQRMSDNLLVPIGITLTVGFYAVGLTSMGTSQTKLGQKMMHYRVLSQGLTIAAMFYDQLNQKSKISRQHQCLKI